METLHANFKQLLIDFRQAYVPGDVSDEMCSRLMKEVLNDFLAERSSPELPQQQTNLTPITPRTEEQDSSNRQTVPRSLALNPESSGIGGPVQFAEGATCCECGTILWTEAKATGAKKRKKSYIPWSRKRRIATQSLSNPLSIICLGCHLKEYPRNKPATSTKSTRTQGQPVERN